MLHNFLQLNLILIFLFGNITFARISRVKISEAHDIGLRIGIYPQVMLEQQDLSKITEIVANDLDYSGQFKVLLLDPKTAVYKDYHANRAIKLDPNDLQNFNFKYWRDLGLEYLLIMQPRSGTRYTKPIINLQLLDLYKPLDPIILTAEVAQDQHEDFRRYVHKISDLIFHKLIGIKSFFNTKIAYIRIERLGTKSPEYSLNIADFDGHNEHKLLVANYPLMSPKWSPDNQQLAFVSFKGNRASINVIDLVHKKLQTLAKFPGINGAPAWSPKGDQLAMVLSKDGDPKIYILDLTNGDLTQVTKGFGIDTEPCWSNDGKEIYFTSSRGSKPQIYKINLKNQAIKKVSVYGEYNAIPIVTKDNRALVMLHCSENCSKTKAEFKIAVQSLENNKIINLTSTGMEDAPTIAPNGTMVMYTTKLNRNGELVLAIGSIDGHFNKYLPILGQGNLRSPTWSSYLD